jgi:hypothetical protein
LTIDGGFHLTIDGWRKNQNDKGWKYLSRKIRELMEQREEANTPDSPEAPVKVKAKARLVNCDLPIMTRLTVQYGGPTQMAGASKKCC